MTPKKEQKVSETISPEVKSHIENILQTQGGGKNKYGHLLSKAGAFIDEMLEQGKGVDEIVDVWTEKFPDKKPITKARVVEQIKHLLSEHNFQAQVEVTQQTQIK